MVISVFDGTFDGVSPVSGLFPRVRPSLVSPEIIEHELMGWKDGKAGSKEGALFKYWEQFRKAAKAKCTQPSQPWPKEFLRLAKHCNVKNEQYRFLKEAIQSDDDEMKRKATKFVKLADMIEEDNQKTVVMCHRSNGFAPLVMYLRKRFPRPHEVGSYPEIVEGRLPPAIPECKKPCRASCAKCYFNRDDNALGEHCRILVLEAKECSEGVSLFCTRKLHLLDVPQTWTSYVQRCVRACMCACGCMCLL
jgi:hypothetical protein